jgi:hypothetical protein
VSVIVDTAEAALEERFDLLILTFPLSLLRPHVERICRPTATSFHARVAVAQLLRV